MKEPLLAIGEAVKDIVLLIADWLKADAAPGLVVIGLLLLLLITTGWLWSWTSRFCKTVRKAQKIISGDGAEDVSGEDISSLARTFYEWRTEGGHYARKLGTTRHAFEEALARLGSVVGTIRRSEAIAVKYQSLSSPRRALLYYALRRLGLDTDPRAREPQDQQIVLLNRDVVHLQDGGLAR